MRKLLLFTFGLCLINVASAQFKLGPQVGINLSSINQNFDDEESELLTKYKLGYEFGLIAAYSCSDTSLFEIQSGFMLVQRGTGYDVKEAWGEGIEGYDRLNLTYGVLPLNAMIKVKNFHVMLGGYLGLGLWGGNQWRLSGDSIRNVPEAEDEIVVEFSNKVTAEQEFAEDAGFFSRSIDYGLNFGLGYQKNNFQIDAVYSLGLANTTPTYVDDPSFDPETRRRTNASISLNLTYFFNLGG